MNTSTEKHPSTRIRLTLAVLVATLLAGGAIFITSRKSPPKMVLTAKSCPTPIGGTRRIGCSKPGAETATPTAPAILTPVLPTGPDQARNDAQGAIEVTVMPSASETAGDEMVFEVSLNTHSVDLSMDVASLATLTTDRGLSVAAARWEAPRGGRHVTGKLYFPAQVEGQPVLAGAQKVTLKIAQLDAPERAFTWTVN